MGKLLLPLLLVGASFAAEPCLIVEEAQDGWKSLTSPDYPKQFNPNTQCIYRITAPKGERIELEFVDFLFITTDNEDCWRQSLSLRDPEVDEIIGKYCGNTKPPNYSTMGNEVFMLLKSESIGEYKGFHVKYRIYGSSPEPASKVAASKAKKSPKKLNRKIPQAVKPKLKQAPQGGIEHINMNIEMQVPRPRHRRQYGRQPNWDYNYAQPQMPPSRPMSRQNRFQAAAEATVTSREGPSQKANKCRKGYPCPEEGNTYEEPVQQRKSSVLCIGCKEKKERSKNYLSYFIWFVVLAIFGGIGWYVYQTYFAADEERKKKEEEDEKKKEAEGNVGAATLARGGHKFSDAPPRYESWQDHAQPLSTTGPPPPSR